MFPGKCKAVSLFIIGNGGRLDVPVDGTRRPEEEIFVWSRKFSLALYVLSSNVRTDEDRAVRLMKDEELWYECKRQESLPSSYQPWPQE
jgi:hypothetical protein